MKAHHPDAALWVTPTHYGEKGAATVEPWRQYQHDVADFYRSLGMDAEVDVRALAGARATHDIDVLVKSKVGGQTITWVVECKQWKRPVPKERVLALQAIVSDLGADRGILMAESGFQAGAYRAAVSSNTTLTSLSDLREDTQDERDAAELGMISLRTAQISQRVRSLWPWASPLVSRGAYTHEELLEVAATSLELTTFIVPALHTGTDVRRYSILEPHMSDAGPLAATARLLDEVEVGLAGLEAKRTAHIAATSSRIERLQSNAMTCVELGAGKTDDPAAASMVHAMREVRGAADLVIASTPKDVANALRDIMVYLLDGVYLLPERGADEHEWERAKDQVNALIARGQVMLASVVKSYDL